MKYLVTFPAVAILLTLKVALGSLVAPSKNHIPADDITVGLTCASGNESDCIVAELDIVQDLGPPPSLREMMTQFHAEFNSLPPGGWSDWIQTNGGLEWLWASPVAVTKNYYNFFPNHTDHNLTCNSNRFSSNNFPDSVRLSGFRLPTRDEVQNFKPVFPPTCMARYINNGAHWCDQYDYDTNGLVTSDQSCHSGCCDTVFVRPVGTSDIGIGTIMEKNKLTSHCSNVGDSDGDGICDNVDNCVDTPNPLQGYAFLDIDASCFNMTIELDQYGLADLLPEDMDNGAIDNCAVAAISGGNTEFHCSDVDSTILQHYSLVDHNGHYGTCIANVTVVDSVGPTINCKNISMSLDSSGQITIDDPLLVAEGVFDACGIDWIQVTPNQFNCKDVLVPQPVVVSAMDNNGNIESCNAQATVINKPPEWLDGTDSMTVIVGSDAVTLFVDASDPEGQPLIYEWNHTCSDDNAVVIFRAVSYSHEAIIHFPHGSQPKCCDVNVQVCDICGSCLVDTTEIILINPNAGSITGNGWYESPLGAYAEDPNSKGVVSFEFDVEYVQGLSVPTGDFEIITPDFVFYSTSFEWLVVYQDDCAKVKGLGSMYGEQKLDCGFSLFVCDSDDRSQKFHDEIVVNIWKMETGTSVYDNGVDSWGVSYEDTIEVKGGNIQLHKGSNSGKKK
ncbi:hypothetical protein IV203_028568 [Nitzschia inconspicua]|uniref:HYR domain-containing protein n=1 Tax=Nitzschia inconspicua TaxID=303405 RepID=A0A9K3LQ42_9STRA|nr:hypothetical protein IV203_028568 [Nitzschia inconspicua]